MEPAIYMDSSPSFRAENKPKMKSNKFGGYYENGKKFTKEKWSEICFIYITLKENLGRKPTRRELACAAHVSENSARRAIRMVRTGAFDSNNETEERSSKGTKEVVKAKTKARTKRSLAEETCSADTFFCQKDYGELFDPGVVNQILWMTINSLNWKLTITPSKVFPMQNTMSLVKDFRHYTSLHASKFASIVANVVDKQFSSNIALQQHSIDGILVSRVEYSFPQREGGLTFEDFRTALSIESLVPESIFEP